MISLSTLLKNELNEYQDERFTPEYQQRINEFFMNYVSDNGDEYPIYLSNHEEIGHVKKRFINRFSNPDKMFFDYESNQTVNAKEYMEMTHSKGKYIKLKWPDDFERFLMRGLDEVERRYDFKPSSYRIEFPSFGLIIPLSVFKFIKTFTPFVVVRTVLHSLFDSAPEGKTKINKKHIKDIKFRIKMESNIYKNNLIEGNIYYFKDLDTNVILEDGNLYSDVPIITII